MKKLYLHMGLPKTGTTSFQESCKANVNKLLEQGYVYPIFNSLHTKNINQACHGVPFYSLYTERPERYINNIRNKVTNLQALHEDYIDYAQVVLSQNKKIIISGEQIATLSVTAMLNFKDFLLKYDFEIIPIVIVRTAYEYLCSMKQEQIKGGCARDELFFVYQSNMVKTIKNIFPETQFYEFKEACKNEDGLVGFLFDQMKVNHKDFKIDKKNESLSNFAARVQNKINFYKPELIKGKLNPNYVALKDWYNTQNSENFLSNQKFLLTEAEYLLIKDKCDAENAYFREHLGEEFCDKEIKFSTPDPIADMCIALIDALEAKRLTPEEKKVIYKDYLFKYNRYRLLSEITFGKKRKHYKQKKNDFKKKLELYK